MENSKFAVSRKAKLQKSKRKQSIYSIIMVLRKKKKSTAYRFEKKNISQNSALKHIWKTERKKSQPKRIEENCPRDLK